MPTITSSSAIFNIFSNLILVIKSFHTIQAPTFKLTRLSKYLTGSRTNKTTLKYDTNKFTKVEKVTYKQLIQKLEVQLDEINSELAKKVGYNKTLRGLLDIPDINKQMEIEHAYTDYSYYTLNW